MENEIQDFGIKKVSLRMNFDAEMDLIHSESEIYPKTALLADIGGATGLFLGLSVVGFIEKIGVLAFFIMKKCFLSGRRNKIVVESKCIETSDIHFLWQTARLV